MLRNFGMLALAAALAAFAGAPAHAIVGYGVEAGTPMYDALRRGYRPGLEGQVPQRLPER